VKRKVVLVGIGLLVAMAAGAAYFWPFNSNSAMLRLPGIVEIQEVRLGSKVGGRVREIAEIDGRPLEGKVVEPYQPLVYFDGPELRAQFEQAKAKAEAAKAAYERARSGPREEEKEWARQAAQSARLNYERLKAGPREEEKRQAKSELDSAQADWKQAIEDYERINKLYQQRSASRSEYDAAISTRDRTHARFRAARARWDLLQRNRQEDIDQALAEWKKAEAKVLEMAKNRDEDIAEAKARWEEAQAKVSEIQANLEELVVKAPKRAIVEIVTVRKGDLVPPNQPIIRVLYLEDLWVKAYVPEPDLGKIHLGQKVEVTIDTYKNKRFPGEVYFISPVSEFTPRNVQSMDERRHQVFAIKVRLHSGTDIFHAGMAAEVFVPKDLSPGSYPH
jgi:membrane fusion protein YbhG